MSYVYELTQEIDNFLKDTIVDEPTAIALLKKASDKLKGLDEMIMELNYDNKQKYDAIQNLQKKNDRLWRVLREFMDE